MEPGGHETKGVPSERERLIQKALITLTTNIKRPGQEETVNLKDRLLQADQNPIRREMGEVLTDFNSVSVEGLFGASARKGSIFMKPYLNHKDIQKGTFRMNVQPMGIHLDRIEKDKDRRLELAEGIWSGVSRDEKIALLLNYIERKKISEEAEVAQMPSHVERDEISPSSAERYVQDMRQRIQIISSLQQAVEEDRLNIEVSDADASLIFSPVDRELRS